MEHGVPATGKSAEMSAVPIRWQRRRQAPTMPVMDKIRKAVVVAGPNGAGKTTFVHQYLETHQGLEYLSADDIALELSPRRPEMAYVRAGKIFFRRLRGLLAAHQSFVTEVTLSSSRLGRHLVAFHEAGYEVEIVFIHLESAELCVARVAERVRKGGHPVLPADIRRRYGRSVRNFWTRYRLAVDGWFLMQNSSQAFQLVAYGTNDSLIVEDPALYDGFLRGLVDATS
jgi:predicted ABC-type ATPase